MLTGLGILALGTFCGIPDDGEDFIKAVRKFSSAEASSYAFRMETRSSTTLGNAMGGIPQTEGKFEKTAGLYLKVGDRVEVFRRDGRTFTKQVQGEWQEFVPPAGGPAPETPPPPVPGAGGRRPMLGRMMLRSLKAPHEEIAGLEKGLRDVKKAEASEKIGELECAVFSGDFSDEAMKETPLGQMIPRFGDAASGLTGQARIWVDPEGRLVRYEISNRVSVEFQGNAVELSLTRTASISDAGKTAVEVPDGVRKLLGEKTEDPGKSPAPPPKTDF
jgi:hypothetical protein